MPGTAICKRLVEKGQELFDGPRVPFTFTGEPPADALVSNLEDYPHAFVLACIMDRQIQATRAWLIPYIGRNWCKPENPKCGDCYKLCATALQGADG